MSYYDLLVQNGGGGLNEGLDGREHSTPEMLRGALRSAIL